VPTNLIPSFVAVIGRGLGKTGVGVGVGGNPGGPGKKILCK